MERSERAQLDPPGPCLRLLQRVAQSIRVVQLADKRQPAGVGKGGKTQRGGITSGHLRARHRLDSPGQRDPSRQPAGGGVGPTGPGRSDTSLCTITSACG